MAKFFSSKHVLPIAFVAVLLVGVIGGAATAPRWSAWFAPEQDKKPAHVHDHDHDDDDAPQVVHLSDQAQKNLKLNMDNIKLTKVHWRHISVPAQVVERPGSCERVVSAPVGGVITKIGGFRGEVVHPESMIFTIALINEHLHTQQADLFKTAREMLLVEQDRERLQKLVKGGDLPIQKLIDVDYKHQRLSDTIKSLEQELSVRGFTPADLDNLKKTGQFLREITVKVPAFAGGHQHVAHKDDHEPPESLSRQMVYEVEETKVMLGEQVQAGQALCVLADHNHLFIEAKVFSAEAGLVQQAARKGDSVSAHFAADADKIWPTFESGLKIVNLDSRINQASQTLSFYLQLPNKFQAYDRAGKSYRLWRFRPGQRATVRIPVEAFDDVYVLPAAAIVREGPNVYVFREKAGKSDDDFERVGVHLLYEDQHEAVLGTDGLEEGQRIAHNAAVQLNWALRIQKEQGGPQGGCCHH